MMTMSHLNHIHLQYCYCLYKFVLNLITPGELENYVLHDTSLPTLKSFDKATTDTELVVSQITRIFWGCEVHTHSPLVTLNLVSYYPVHLYRAGVFYFPGLLQILVLPFENHPTLWLFLPTLDSPVASSTLKPALGSRSSCSGFLIKCVYGTYTGYISLLLYGYMHKVQIEYMMQRSSQGPVKYTLKDPCTYPIQGYIQS